VGETARYRIRLDGVDADAQDRELRNIIHWLQRESWFAGERIELTPVARRPAEGDRPDMAVGLQEVVLIVLSGIAPEVYRDIRGSLREWNQRRRERGADGEARVAPESEPVREPGAEPVPGAEPHEPPPADTATSAPQDPSAPQVPRAPQEPPGREG
jgi:hypothetical protein